MMYIICPQNRHISERFGHLYDIIFSQLQTTPQKVTYCLSIFKIMLGIFPYRMADLVKSGCYLVESSRCLNWPTISALFGAKDFDSK